MHFPSVPPSESADHMHVQSSSSSLQFLVQNLLYIRTTLRHTKYNRILGEAAQERGVRVGHLKELKSRVFSEKK